MQNGVENTSKGIFATVTDFSLMVCNDGHLKFIPRFDQIHISLNLPVFATCLFVNDS